LALIEHPYDNPNDPDCICYGNWRSIVNDHAHLLNRQYKDKDDNEYTFFGVVFGGDDYYYGLWNRFGLRLLSCVGSIEDFGFTLIEKDKKDE
jgi:hypothetical protein